MVKKRERKENGPVIELGKDLRRFFKKIITLCCAFSATKGLIKLNASDFQFTI